MLGGYCGRLLRVDLSSGAIREPLLEEELLRRYIGGSGLGARLLYDETGPQTDPLGPENRLVFAAGPLTGTMATTSTRHSVCCRSPLTGLWGEASSAGTWASGLKAAGYDAVVVSGCADEPVYLWIADGKTEIRRAGHLWGLDTFDTDSALKAETHPQAHVACIGPAGERLSRLAAIMNDGKEGRAAGRTGVGAVMGSKLLKAIVVHGKQRVWVADEQALRDSVRALTPTILKHTTGMQNYGTDGGLISFEQIGDLPLRNWTQGKWEEGAERISGQHMAETILTGRYHCRTCVIGCGRRVTLERGPAAGKEIGGPEYEACGALGANCLVGDITTVAVANELCNRYGLDVISTGSAVAFAMEAYERGLLTKADTDGLELTFGNGEALLEMVRRIGEREGLGRLLGEGVKRAAEAIGGGAEEFAVHVKGLEPAMHDPRAYASLAVGYATSNRGACHLQGFSHVPEGRVAMPDLGYPEILDRFATAGKGELVAKAQNLMCMYDSLTLCKMLIFGRVRIPDMVNWLNYVTGWDYDADEFMRTGERLYNLKRLYNTRLGVTRADDTLPKRLLSEPRPDGGAAGYLPDLEAQLDEYYAFRGWDAQGIPTAAKLAELGLEK
jgi:aldehyde:ferredoxin oxidoreductase